MSLEFRSAIFGLGMTIFSWFGPWAWPAWPAFAAIQLVFGRGGFTELPFGARSAVVVVLIVWNVSVWGAAAYGLLRILRKTRTA